MTPERGFSTKGEIISFDDFKEQIEKWMIKHNVNQEKIEQVSPGIIMIKSDSVMIVCSEKTWNESIADAVKEMRDEK